MKVLKVQGQGSVSVSLPPDEAVLSFEVEATSADYGACVMQLNARVEVAAGRSADGFVCTLRSGS